MSNILAICASLYHTNQSSFNIETRRQEKHTQDTENGFFMDINKQIVLACERIQSDPALADGYNAVGFSQVLKGTGKKGKQFMTI